MRIDLNADVGESSERWASGEDRELLAVVTSANVCCGAYAGDDELIRATCEAAVAAGVVIGAQVGYPDREGFGRRDREMSSAALTDEVCRQVAHLRTLAEPVGGTVAYVKPHGALYNRIVHDEQQAAAVVAALDGLPLLGLPGGAALHLAREAGVVTYAEGFADRAYTPEGTLVPRSEPGAVLEYPAAVSAQAVRLLGEGVDSLCVHSDSPGALGLARAVRRALEDAGADVHGFVS